MNKVIFFSIGLVVGAGIGVLASRGYYRKLAFQEISEVRDIYRKKTAAKEQIERNEELKKQFLDEKSASVVSKSTKNDAKIVDFNRYSELREPYSGGNIELHNVFSNPLNASEIDNEEDDDSDPYEIFVDHEAPSEGFSEPYEISEEEFASEKLFYDKVMIEYYDDGIAVLEDSDQIVESIEELIGPDILKGKSVNENEFYVHNRSTDYGIRFTGTDFVPEEGLD